MEKNNCTNCNGSCQQACQASYSNKPKSNFINYSFTMNGKIGE